MIPEKFEEKELYNQLKINDFLTIIAHDEPICITSCLDMIVSDIVPGNDVGINAPLETHETIPEAPYFEGTLKNNKYSHKIDTHRISVTGLAQQKADELKETHGIDISAMIKSALFAEANQSITKDYLTKINNLASKNTPIYIGIIQKVLGFIYKIFNKIYVPKYIIKDANEIIKHIIVQSNLIAIDTRLGPGTFAIVSTRIANLISDNQSYQYESPNSVINNDLRILHKVGQIAGVEIYVDPNKSWTDNTIIVGRRSTDTDPGLILVRQKEGTNIQIITEHNTTPQTNLTLKYSIVENGLKPEANFRQITLAKFKL